MSYRTSALWGLCPKSKPAWKPKIIKQYVAPVFILSLLSFFQYEVEIDAKIIRVSGRKVQLEKFCSQEAKNFVEHWEEQKNKSHIHIGKDKGRTENITHICIGKDKEKLKNITHIHKGKDKGRTEKQKPYSYKERQGKN